MLVARCYSGSRDQVEIYQKREYISVNGNAAFSSLQTRLTTLAKLSVDVSDVFGHERSRKGLQYPREALN